MLVHGNRCWENSRRIARLEDRRTPYAFSLRECCRDDGSDETENGGTSVRGFALSSSTVMTKVTT